MKIIGVIVLILSAAIAVWFALPRKEESRQGESFPRVQTSMRITSPAFAHGEEIPSRYTCDGENINPPFVFEDVPEEAKSLALISDDPDAPAGTWVHWTFWNLDPRTERIPEGARTLSAVEGKTSFGTPGYGGPCPPSGTHRYFFKLYALDTTLDLDASASKEDLLAAMEGHILARADLMGTYTRR